LHQLAPDDAYSYLTSRMMIRVHELFQSDAFDFTAKEKELLKTESIDALLTYFYKIYEIPFKSVKHPTLRGHQMPLITRQALGQWIVRQVAIDPVNSLCV
jgi:hypothetical protein